MQYPNWFEIEAIKFFTKHLLDYSNKDNIKYLQIGTYTGDASVWLMDNVLTSSSAILVDVDTWEGSDEAVHKEWDWKSVEEVYDQKVKDYSNIIKMKMRSDEFFKQNKDTFDFIYIDGDHTEAGTYADAAAAWKGLNTNGILAFDDYCWEHESGLNHLRPAPAIDQFVGEHRADIEILDIGYQYWIRKKS